MNDLKPHHLEALRAANQHAADMPDKPWLHPRYLKGSKVADELAVQGLLERSLKPAKEWANGTERIFTYRITEAGKTVVQPPKKPRTPQELEDELAAAQQRNDALQRSLIEANAASEAHHLQALTLAERLIELEGQGSMTPQTNAHPAAYQPNAEDKILASLSIHDYPSLFYLHIGEKMVSVELFSDKAIEKKLVEPDGNYTKLTKRGVEVAAAVVEYVVRLLPAEEVRLLIEQARTDKPYPGRNTQFQEMRMNDRAGYITDFGRAVAAAAQIIEAGFTLADVTPAPAPDPVIAALKAKIDQQAAEMMTLKQLLETAEKLAIDKTRDKRKADERITALEKDVTTLTEQRDTARTLAETYQREKEKAIADAQKWQREHAKVAAAHNKVNELLEAFTSQYPDGHLVIRDATAEHLDRFTDEGRAILNISFNRDDDMILVVGPKPTAPVQPERSTARNETPTQPRRPVPPPVQQPPAPRSPAPVMPTAIQPNAIVPVAPLADDIRRVPTFMEIVEARTSGRIDAAQFTRFANALAGYNASKKA